MERQHQVGSVTIRGRQEMQQLVVSTFAALERRGLTDLFDVLHRRLFTRPPQDLMDVQRAGDVSEWRFKPIIELLLRHIAQTADHDRMSTMDRQAEIVWAIEMAGF